MRNIPLFKVFMSPDVIEPLNEVLMSGYIGQGPKVDQFESKLKKLFKNDCILTTNSCTSALQLAVHLIKPPEGFTADDEIIAPPLTCFASISAILANNVKVRWADVDPETCNIDLLDVERKLGPNTRAVMVVHWGGRAVDLDHLKQIQVKYQELYGRELPVIEDCAHCWNSKYKKTLVGNSGNYCCFSFQAIKFLNTGDGGLLITPNMTTHKRAKLLRWFGLDRDSGASFRCIQDIPESGFKYHLNDIAASIGLSNLHEMDNIVERHKSNARYFVENLSFVSGITPLKCDDNVDSCYWIFTLKVEDRKKFVDHLEANGIASSPVHARCDKHSCVSEFRSFLPGMDYLDSRHVSIPCGWWLTDEDRSHVVDCIKKGW